MWASNDAINVLIGVASSALWLWLLFSAKPTLGLTFQRQLQSSDDPRKPETWQKFNGQWGQDPEEKSNHLSRTKSSTPKGALEEDLSERVTLKCSCEPKPRRLQLTREEYTNTWLVCSQCFRQFQPTAEDQNLTGVHYRVKVENRGLSSVVDVEARLWLIKHGRPVTRQRIPLEIDQLMELNGKWREARRLPSELTGDRFFRFRLPAEISSETIDEKDSYLIQVRSKHGFTNFGRVHKLRIKPQLSIVSHSPADRLVAENPDAMRWHLRRWSASLTTKIANTAKHITEVYRQYKWHLNVTYFAYGSNMAPDTIAQLCPKHRYLGVACLEGYRLAFTRQSVKTGTGVADIIPVLGGEAEDNTVSGVLYKIDQTGLEAIDRKEGFPHAYRRGSVQVKLRPGRRYYSAQAYMVKHKDGSHIPPSPQYLQNLIDAADERELPQIYVERLVDKGNNQIRARAPVDQDRLEDAPG